MVTMAVFMLETLKLSKTLKSSRDNFNVLDNFNVSSIKTADAYYLVRRFITIERATSITQS